MCIILFCQRSYETHELRRQMKNNIPISSFSLCVISFISRKALNVLQHKICNKETDKAIRKAIRKVMLNAIKHV